MHYKRAYLHLFRRLADTIKFLESCDPATEKADITQLLKALQLEAEEICTH